MKKNARHVIEIKEATSKGFGLGYVGDFVVFVADGLPGDVIDTIIVKVKKTYGYGKIAQIITPSPFRKKSPCAVSEQCGGCQWQHCDYNAQLGFKKQIVIKALEKIGGLKNPPVNDVIGMENPIRYRNKAVFPVTPQGIGMYALRSHRLIEITDCNIQHIAHIGIISAVKKYMLQYKIIAYDEIAHKGLVRHIIIRTSFSSGEVMVVLVLNGKKLPAPHAAFIEELAAQGVTTILINENTTKGNTIMGDNFKTLSGTGYIYEKIGDAKYQLSAPSFFQINPVQTTTLYETALSQAALDGTQDVIDAHCGVGSIAIFVAKHARHVLGVDIVAPAVADAQKNAELNGIKNADFVCGAAEEVIPRLMQSGEISPDVVFLDPPRKGCEKELLHALCEALIKKIVYVSCDPATLARDIKILVEGGYEIVTVQPVDMFPFTGKVETSVLLRHRNT
ncbi:MAG: 23S rRNA (uracil(1939)-C(5))-methyltransferase RlmD [Defluviitaleaceae bacterium]|nr:23S rRNA (uracil(1939)-C(5))-methyltransferase RlmD [Defluviitaleaceae bacterium]